MQMAWIADRRHSRGLRSLSYNPGGVLAQTGDTLRRWGSEEPAAELSAEKGATDPGGVLAHAPACTPSSPT